MQPKQLIPLAPPTGVEPVTYRLGDSGVNEAKAVDSDQHSPERRPILQDDIRSNFSVITDPSNPLLDGIIAGLAIVAVIATMAAVAVALVLASGHR